MVDFAIGSVQRSLVHQRQQATDARNDATQRLATGRKVSGIKDNPVDYLRANALLARVQDLSSVKADIGRGIDTLAATQVGLDSVDKLVRQLKGIAHEAAGNEDQRATLARQFDVVRNQIDNLVGDVSYRGTNLIDNPADALDVSTSDKPGTDYSVAGRASDVASLGIGNAASYNDFADLASIQNAIDALDSASRTVRSNASSIGAGAAILQVRESFTDNLSNVLETGASKLTVADLNEEAAKVVAAGVRDALSVNGLRVAAQSESALVAVLSGQS
jgi:flagellin